MLVGAIRGAQSYISRQIDTPTIRHIRNQASKTFDMMLDAVAPKNTYRRIIVTEALLPSVACLGVSYLIGSQIPNEEMISDEFDIDTACKQIGVDTLKGVLVLSWGGFFYTFGKVFLKDKID